MGIKTRTVSIYNPDNLVGKHHREEDYMPATPKVILTPMGKDKHDTLIKAGKARRPNLSPVAASESRASSAPRASTVSSVPKVPSLPSAPPSESGLSSDSGRSSPSAASSWAPVTPRDFDSEAESQLSELRSDAYSDAHSDVRSGATPSEVGSEQFMRTPRTPRFPRQGHESVAVFHLGVLQEAELPEEIIFEDDSDLLLKVGPDTDAKYFRVCPKSLSRASHVWRELIEDNPDPITLMDDGVVFGDESRLSLADKAPEGDREPEPERGAKKEAGAGAGAKKNRKSVVSMAEKRKSRMSRVRSMGPGASTNPKRDGSSSKDDASCAPSDIAPSEYDYFEDEVPEWIIELPNEDPMALSIIMRIIHGEMQNVPQTLELEELYEVTLLTYKYEMTPYLAPWIPSWRKVVDELRDEDIQASGAEVLWITFELGIPHVFERAAMDMIMHATRDSLWQIATKELITPPGIMEEIHRVREQTIDALLTVIRTLVDALQNPTIRLCELYDDTQPLAQRRCEALALGSLVLGLVQADLYPVPASAAAYRGSAAALAEALRGLAVMDLGGATCFRCTEPEVADDHRACNPKPFLDRDLRHVLRQVTSPVLPEHERHITGQMRRMKPSGMFAAAAAAASASGAGGVVEGDGGSSAGRRSVASSRTMDSRSRDSRSSRM